jgi:ribosomal protein L29
MKYKEIKNLSEKEQEKNLAKLRMDLVKLNLQVSTGTSLKKSKEIRDKKKEIARILTVKNCEPNKKVSN